MPDSKRSRNTGALFIGTAAWSLPKIAHPLFPEEGSHLERYASVLNGVEINSSFYRDHQPKTYARWAASVPETFRFSVKLSRFFTHERKLGTDSETRKRLAENLDEYSHLGEKLSVILIQLPPSLRFEDSRAEAFFSELAKVDASTAKIRKSFHPLYAIEPRHPTWTSSEALALLKRYAVARVEADPEVIPAPSEKEIARAPFTYVRLHGSPEIYRSDYPEEFLRSIAARLKAREERGGIHWCVFDNTTFGYATLNAVRVRALSREERSTREASLRSPHPR